MDTKVKPKPLADRQEEVLLYIYKVVIDEGRRPTHRELMSHFGWRSTHYASQVIKRLTQLGYLEAGPRGVKSGYKFLRLPDGQKFNGLMFRR